MWKKILLFLIIILLLSGCGRKRMHSKKELLNYIDNLTCYEKDESCNLKDNYTVISEKKYKDENNKKVRELTLKLNNYDFEFTVKSIYKCTGVFSASCYERGYTEITDYRDKSNEYFANQYSKYLSNDCSFSKYSILSCTVTNKSNLETVASSISGYISYLNKQDIKIDNKEIYLDLQYHDRTNYYYNGKPRHLTKQIYVFIENGTYYAFKYTDNNTKKVKLDNLEEYILDLYAENNVKLEDQ